MIEIGVFHNGASDLPAITTPQEVVVNDGSLDEVHQSYGSVSKVEMTIFTPPVQRHSG